MSSKKQRKKLKQQYDKKDKSIMFNRKERLSDRNEIINYFKHNLNRIITANELISHIKLNDDTRSSVSKNIKAINYYTDTNIKTVRGRFGGYIYYG